MSGFLSYTLQIILGRILPAGDYVFFNVFMGALEILSVPVMTIQMAVSRQTTEYVHTDRSNFLAPFFKKMIHSIIKVGALLFILIFIFSVPLTNFLKSPSLWPIYLLGFCSIILVLNPIALGILQGLQELNWFTLFRGLVGPSRFLFCSVIALITGEINGAILGIFLSLLFLLIIQYVKVKRILGESQNNSIPIPIPWMDYLPILLANMAFITLSQIDLIFVNHFAQSSDAIIFSPAVILARSHLHITGALVVALFPMVSAAKIKNMKTIPILMKALKMTLLVCGSGAIIFYFYSKEILALLFSHQYDNSFSILKYYGINTLLLSLILVLNNFFIAKGRSAYAYILMVGVLLEAVIISKFRSEILNIVFINIGVLFSIILAGLFLAKENDQTGRKTLKVIQ